MSKMFISATPKLAILYHASDPETTLIIECKARDNSGVLEIGKKHVFASRKNRSFLSRRHACHLEVRIKRRSSASEKAAESLGLSKDKIGELSFCPPSKADEVNAASPASLEATVFLDDELFDSLMNMLYLGKRPRWLQLDIEKEGALGYGWEPDGSRMEWKIDNPSDPASVDVTRIAMGLKLFG
jgi:hypothetical protein